MALMAGVTAFSRKWRKDDQLTVLAGANAGSCKTSCRGCLRPDLDCKRCSRCLVAYYCSKECQKKEIYKHKKLCCIVQKHRLVKTELGQKVELAKTERDASRNPDGKPDVHAEEHYQLLKGLYLNALIELDTVLVAIGTDENNPCAYDAALSYEFELLREGFSLQRGHTPFVLLAMNFQQDCYDFIKWWAIYGPDRRSCIHGPKHDPLEEQRFEWICVAQSYDMTEDLFEDHRACDMKDFNIYMLLALILLKCLIIMDFESSIELGEVDPSSACEVIEQQENHLRRYCAALDLRNSDILLYIAYPQRYGFMWNIDKAAERRPSKTQQIISSSYFAFDKRGAAPKIRRRYETTKYDWREDLDDDTQLSKMMWGLGVGHDQTEADGSIMHTIHTCCYCLRRSEACIKCPNCLAAFYCTRACQQKMFPVHDGFCLKIRMLEKQKTGYEQEKERTERTKYFFKGPDGSFNKRNIEYYQQLEREYFWTVGKIDKTLVLMGVREGNKYALEAALSCEFESMRHGHSYLRRHTPFVQLAANKQQDCYDFIQWWTVCDKQIASCKGLSEEKLDDENFYWDKIKKGRYDMMGDLFEDRRACGMEDFNIYMLLALILLKCMIIEDLELTAHRKKAASSAREAIERQEKLLKKYCAALDLRSPDILLFIAYPERLPPASTFRTQECFSDDAEYVVRVTEFAFMQRDRSACLKIKRRYEPLTGLIPRRPEGIF